MSVIIPCYNRAALVRETLDSVRGQTHRPIEIIVVDDGSTDGSRESVARWIEEKSKGDALSVTLLHQENGGPSAARNAGTRASTGEYLQFLDSDDILHPEKLTTQVDAITHGKVEFCVCNYRTFNTTVDIPGTTINFFSRPHSPDAFPWHYPMDTPAPLYTRRAVVLAGPWNISLRASEDFEFNFRLVCRGGRGVWIDETLVFVRKHDSGERIQATPLRDRYEFMLAGLQEMERVAREAGVCSRVLLRNLGLRALTYREHMRREGSEREAEVFKRYATDRVEAWRRILFLARSRYWRPLCRNVRVRTQAVSARRQG